jgi:hypothetical protein
MARIVDSLIYNFQDRFKPLKDIQKRAGLVPEAEDAALAEERYSGKVRARTDEFEASMREPLIKAIHESGVEYDDVEEYLHALHAPSRNAAMREINPTEQELKDKTDALTTQRDALANDADVAEYLKLRRELRQAEGDIEDGMADESLARAIKQDIAQLRKVANVADYMDALEKLKALRLVKPFQGDNTALSGMSNAESAAVIAKIDANGTRKALERVSAIIDGITSKTRQIFIDSGLETPETIEKWNEKYEHYVPLHRDEVGGSAMPRIGQGFNIRGRESKRATGSNREVTDILAHVVAQHEAAIIRSEKTQVDQALFKFAQMHPDPALWTLDTAPMIRTVDQTSGSWSTDKKRQVFSDVPAAIEGMWRMTGIPFWARASRRTGPLSRSGGRRSKKSTMFVRISGSRVPATPVRHHGRQSPTYHRRARLNDQGGRHGQVKNLADAPPLLEEL